MNIKNTIIKKCADTGITVTALERLLGFGKGTIGKWDVKSPTVDNLVKVANYFGCSVDSLIGIKADPLSDDERTLIDTYNSLSLENREMMEDLLLKLLRSQQ